MTVAQRLWLPSTGTPPVSVANDVGWANQSTIYLAAKAVLGPIASAMADTTHSGASTTINAVVHGQWVSEPLAAQLISGTFSAQIRAIRGAATGLYVAFCARVVSLDGGTVRATLLSIPTGRSGTAVTSAALTNRTVSAALTPYTCTDGDRLVIEAGHDKITSTGSHNAANLRIGDSGASDLPVDNTTTTDLNPWLEISNGLELWRPRPLLLVA